MLCFCLIGDISPRLALREDSHLNNIDLSFEMLDQKALKGFNYMYP